MRKRLKLAIGSLMMPATALLISLLTIFPLVQVVGVNPWLVYRLILLEPFLSTLNLQEVFSKTTPLILTGLSVAVAFRVGYFSIGAEGQLYAGALVATGAGIFLGGIPSFYLIPLILILGFLAGAVWALPMVWMKIRYGVEEIVTTLLSNYIVILLVGAILSGPWRDPVTRWPQSPEIAPSAVYPTLFNSNHVHLGLLLGIGLTVSLGWLLFKTTWGFEIRAVGANPDAARYAGINVGRVIFWTALLSGGLAGLAGVGEVLGVHHHLIQAISPGFGFTGIAVATLANLNPWGTLISAFFFGIVNTGSRLANIKANIPTDLSEVIQGIILIAVVMVSLLAKKGKLAQLN